MTSVEVNGIRVESCLVDSGCFKTTCSERIAEQLIQRGNMKVHPGKKTARVANTHSTEVNRYLKGTIKLGERTLIHDVIIYVFPDLSYDMLIGQEILTHLRETYTLFFVNVLHSASCTQFGKISPISKACRKSCRDLSGKITVAPYDLKKRDFIVMQSPLKMEKFKNRNILINTGPKINTKNPVQRQFSKDMTTNPSSVPETFEQTKVPRSKFNTVNFHDDKNVQNYFTHFGIREQKRNTPNDQQS